MTTHVALARAKARITRKANEFNDKADAGADDMQTAIDYAMADGLALALEIIVEEEQS